MQKEYVLIVREIQKIEKFRKVENSWFFSKTVIRRLFSEYHLAFNLRTYVTEGYTDTNVPKCTLRLLTSYLLVKNPRGLRFVDELLVFCNILKIEKKTTITIWPKSNSADNRRDSSLTHLFTALPSLLQSLLERRLCLLILWEEKNIFISISRNGILENFLINK